MDEGYNLPLVDGRTINRSLADFERACLVCLQNEQAKGDFSDSHLIGVLADAVRLAREYCDAVKIMGARR